ncbi:MAG: hypothetical protein M3450_13545 [Actinomycetota bacterium]|nr:hypothetical protein [Actinomycetota bacterium]MDQ3642450.1 hypothetical protein [Actinomycetota bacterium]
MKRGLISARVLMIVVLAGAAPYAGAEAMSPTSPSRSSAVPSPARPATDGAAPDATPRPPLAVLASATAKASAETGSFCWSVPGEGVTCSIIIFIDPAGTLVIREGEAVELRFLTRALPVEVTGRRFDAPSEARGTPFALRVGNPTRFTASFRPGLYWLVFESSWDEGHATYFAKVRVMPRPQRPAPTRPLVPAAPASPIQATPRFTG